MATTKTTKSNSGISKEVAKVIQIALNAKGANLKVDGIIGPKTQGALDSFNAGTLGGGSGGSTVTSSKSTISPTSSKSSSRSINQTPFVSATSNKAPTTKSTLIPTNATKTSAKDALNKATVVKEKTPIFANPFAGAGFFSNLKTGLGVAKDAVQSSFSGLPFKNQSASAGDFRVGENLSTPQTVQAYKTLGSETPITAATGSGSSPKDNTSLEVTGSNADNYQSNLNPDMPVSTPDRASEVQAPVSSGGSSGGVNTKIVTPLEDGSTQTQTFNSVSAPTIGNPNIASRLNDLNLGLKTGLGADNTTWQSTASRGEFQTRKIAEYANNAAQVFNTQQEAQNFYNTPEGQKSAADYVANGGKIEDIIAKVKPAINGITAPKTTAEFLAYSGKAVEQERKLLNESIANEYNMTQNLRDAYFGKQDANGNSITKGVVEQQRDENTILKEHLERQDALAERSQREKAQFMIDKARAEFEIADAETELKRIAAKENLVNFLAHIGALNTDGNAVVGIEKLEQAYQAQRQQLRQNFGFAEREIRMNMNDRINELESDKQDKIFKLNQDLSKTEREISLEGMKLEYDYRNKMISYNMKFQDAIKVEQNKADTKALSYANAYSSTLWKLMSGAGGLPEDIARSMIDNQGRIIATQENINLVNQYTPEKQLETKPAYTGETLKTFKNKTVNKLIEAGGAREDIDWVNGELNHGWSLEQVARNSGMSNAIYSIFKDNLK